MLGLASTSLPPQSGYAAESNAKRMRLSKPPGWWFDQRRPTPAAALPGAAAPPPSRHHRSGGRRWRPRSPNLWDCFECGREMVVSDDEEYAEYVDGASELLCPRCMRDRDGYGDVSSDDGEGGW